MGLYICDDVPQGSRRRSVLSKDIYFSKRKKVRTEVSILGSVKWKREARSEVATECPLGKDYQRKEEAFSLMMT